MDRSSSIDSEWLDGDWEVHRIIGNGLLQLMEERYEIGYGCTTPPPSLKMILLLF